MPARGLILALLLAPHAAVAAETWWSLRPLARPAVPAVRDGTWARNPIDAFVLAALERRGLHPSPEADRRTLLRRLSFDLVGLPPAPEEVEAFINDVRPGAYERLVDRLLASPAYGERWGRHWLDVAHYGDTHGYDKDKRRDHAWPYRDWVIRALNADLPYRDFVRLQLAGDVLRPADADALTATGFVVAGPWDFVGHVELREGTVDKEKTRLIDRDDMVSNALGTFLSVTGGCARCHDHKFDPIPTRDYYRLQAVFAGVERGPRPLRSGVTEERQKLLAGMKRLTDARAALVAKIDALTGPAVAEIDGRLGGVRKALDALPPMKGAPSPSNGWHSAIMPTAGATKWVQVDLGSMMSVDEVRLIPARPTDFRDAPGFGFPVRFKVELADEPSFARPNVVADHTGEDFANPGNVPYSLSLKGQKARYIRVTATRLWKRSNDYAFALAELQVESGGKDVAAGRPVTALDSIEAGRWGRRFLVDGFDSRQRLPDRSDAAVTRAYRERLRLQAAARELEQQRRREVERRTPPALTAERARLDCELAKLAARLRRPEAGPMVYAPLPIAPRPIWVLRRGDVEQRKEEVTPGALSCVTMLSPDLKVQSGGEGARRVALADWIVDDRNPLTWRSIANRAWHYHFGRGIVDTPNELGKMGGSPSHPELLDWLAADLREHGSLKQLHRLIVTSATYRQSSGQPGAWGRNAPTAAEAARVDADNRYLWRMNRRRLDAESLRDAVLSVAGTLDRRMGGPGYELFRYKDDHSPVYDHSDRGRVQDPATYRRTVYRFTVRSVPNPFLDCLDCADPNQATPVRNTTLTALQALALLNNPFVVRQARHFAERLEATSTDVEAQVEQAYRLAFGRPPSAAEREAVAAHARRYGLAAACRVLLNANEFVFVD